MAHRANRPVTRLTGLLGSFNIKTIKTEALVEKRRQEYGR
jgi:hypothetical protein